VPDGDKGPRGRFLARWAHPDEEFTAGPSASFQVPLPQAPAPKKKWPLAWLALAAGILVIALATFFALRGRGGDEAAESE
jgi:hypothetical protein